MMCNPSVIVGFAPVIFVIGLLAPAVAVAACLRRFRKRESGPPAPLSHVLLAKGDVQSRLRKELSAALGIGAALFVGALHFAPHIGRLFCP
jgi:hypothetical protein